MKPRTTTPVHIPKEIHKRAKLFCVAAGLPLQKWIAETITKTLDAKKIK